MKKVYREGAIGALLDEYERAIGELKQTISGIDPENFTKIADKETKDPECVSIQSVINHTINAGYAYVNGIKKRFVDPESVREKCLPTQTALVACDELDKMMNYTIDNIYKKFPSNFEGFKDDDTFFFEEMLEHAIVHILRHRRQIERFMQPDD